MATPQGRTVSLIRGVLRSLRSALRAVLGGVPLRRVEVTGDSMEPTLRAGDRLVVVRLSETVRPGQIVVVRDPRDQRRHMIKRVVRVLHDRIEVRGDNADSSTDSRHFGFVDLSLVEGVARYRYFPASRAGSLDARSVSSVEGDGSESFISQRTQ
ncbi:MAG: nickel-type superoxide dismutase maturation protease [Acidimicrobiales bacterium]